MNLLRKQKQNEKCRDFSCKEYSGLFEEEKNSFKVYSAT